MRLGESYGALKAHSWFENFDWDKLLEKELKAPFLPIQEKYLSEQELKELEGYHVLVQTVIQSEQ